MEEIEEVFPGEIFAMFGVECDSGTTFIKEEKKQTLSLSSMHVPDAVISLSLKPKQKQGLGNLQKSL